MFRVNNVAIKNPSSFKIERYNVTTLERLADASMVGDLIAKKLKFFFTYDALTSYELDNILAAIWDAPGLFFPLEYKDNGVTKTVSVYVGSIPADLHRAGKTTNWVWKNVNFSLIER